MEGDPSLAEGTAMDPMAWGKTQKNIQNTYYQHQWVKANI